MILLFAHGGELHADDLLLIAPLLLVALVGAVLMIRGARSPDEPVDENSDEEQAPSAANEGSQRGGEGPATNPPSEGAGPASGRF